MLKRNVMPRSFRVVSIEVIAISNPPDVFATVKFFIAGTNAGIPAVTVRVMVCPELTRNVIVNVSCPAVVPG